MKNKRIWLGVMIVLLFLAAYITGLRRNFDEKRRWSLELTDEIAMADRVLVSIQVLRVDPAARQLTVRLRFRLAGSIAEDAVTPKVNLKLLVNSFPGQHVFEFPKGAAMVRVEATFPLEGDPNRYPFDQYESSLELFMNTPRSSSKSQVPAPRAPEVLEAAPEDATQPVDVASVVGPELRSNVPVPLSISVSASTPGMKYAGEVIRSKDFGVASVHLRLKRPDNLINTSIVVMCLMMGLALSVLAMVIRTITFREKFDVLPLSFCISLIFGLPALRNIQPYVPPVGVLGDYFSFIWAELLVAASAMITALMWVWRSKQKSESKLGS